MNLYHIIGALLILLPLLAITYRISQEEAGGIIAAVTLIFGLSIIAGVYLLSL